MPYTEAQRRATEKWNSANLESVNIRVPKGTRDRWHGYAAAEGMSLASYVQDAVEAKAASGQDGKRRTDEGNA